MRILMMIGLLAAALALGACGGGSTTAPSAADTQAIAADTSFSSRGDAKRGEEAFLPCSACHSTGTDQIVGPGMAGIFSPEGPTLPSAADYGGKLPNGQPRTETNVAAWIKSGGQGKIGIMTPQALDDQQLADVIAYLRTLKK